MSKLNLTEVIKRAEKFEKKLSQLINATEEGLHNIVDYSSEVKKYKDLIAGATDNDDINAYTKSLDIKTNIMRTKLGLTVDSQLNMDEDKRVSLTVRPRQYNIGDNTSSLSKRVGKILSTGEGLTGGILYKSLGNSFGIIFPYTPNISGFGKTVNYDTIQVPHSNLSFNQYKNTNPTDLTIKAKFTADNRKNALSMISSIWFLNACSSSKFGKNDDEAGLPPPVLYLNGYNDMIDNIPVVISSFDYNLDDKSQYVKLIVSSDGEIIEELEKKRDSNLIYWLPTELDVSIKLKIQPNVRKVSDEWSLDKYKKGELFGSSSKSNSKYIPSGWTW